MVRGSRGRRGVAYNRGRGMPEDYKQKLDQIAKTNTGKKALHKYRQFWGIPHPTDIDEMEDGKSKNTVLVGAGRTTGVYLADTSNYEDKTKTWNIKRAGRIAFDVNGRRVFILSNGSQKNFGKDLKFVGYARETHYIPTGKMEKAGSFKKGKYWIHKADDDGGRFPRVYKDKAGNFIYAPGTLRINKWMER
jgi:hypothetical protein